jgi:hypothetical protein
MFQYVHFFLYDSASISADPRNKGEEPEIGADRRGIRALVT